LVLAADFAAENKGDRQVARRRLLLIAVFSGWVSSARMQIFKTLIENGLQ
jgi:hypothetical protein